MKLKNWMIVIIICIGLFSFYTLSHAKQEGLSWSDLPDNHALKHEKLLVENETLQHVFLFPESSFDAEESLQIIESIQKLPLSILSKLVDHGVRVKLFNGKLTDNPSAAYLKGTTPRGYGNNAKWDDVPGMGGSHTVLVKIGVSDKGNGHSSVNLELHELAHSIDTIVYGGIQDEPEFLSIWGKEVHILFPNQPYFINYPEEYFAEVFAMFYVNQLQNERLKLLAPHTYAYIKQLN